MLLSSLSPRGLAAPRSARLHLAASFLAALALAGCGGDDGDSGDGNDPPEPDELCAIDISISGARSGRAEYTSCSGFALEGDHLIVRYGQGLGSSELDWSVDLDIGPVTPDQPSSGLPMVVQIFVFPDAEHDDLRWESGAGTCTADLSVFEPAEDDFFGPGHRIVGSGSCTGPATADPLTEATGEVTISPFEFHFFASAE